MTTNTQHFLRAYLAITALAMSASFAYGYTTMQPMKAGNITYVTGGIGDEERYALQSVKNRYNLSIVSAANTGAYVGDTRVTISDTAGQELVDTHAGPLFYANLPPGKYVVEGQSEGQMRTQNITIAENKPAHIHFSWK